MENLVIARLCRFLYGFETMIEAILGDACCLHIVRMTEDGGAVARTTVNKWNPAYWIGFGRCVILGDRCGSMFYRREGQTP